MFFLKYLIMSYYFLASSLSGEINKNQGLLCKVINSDEHYSFIFESNDKVQFKKKIKNKIVSEGSHSYETIKDLIIIYNYDVLPMREETHINLKTLEMKTGIFTTRYPLIRKGCRLYFSMTVN